MKKNKTIIITLEKAKKLVSAGYVFQPAGTQLIFGCIQAPIIIIDNRLSMWHNNHMVKNYHAAVDVLK